MISIGQKIRKYREIRGWTQEYLAQKIGLSASAIRKYENGNRMPKDSQLIKIAEGLGIHVGVFQSTNIDNLIHALFDMEDVIGLHPEKIGDEYILKFDSSKAKNLYEISCWEQNEFMKSWYEAHKSYISAEYSSNEELQKIQEQYDLWRASYPP